MKSLTLQPIARVDGIVKLLGSKSISSRVLLLSALTNDTTILTNLLNSDDIYYMLNALKALGIRYNLSKNRTQCVIIGNNGTFKITKNLYLFLGNAGIAVRMLTALLCLDCNNIVITGDQRMKERPIGHLIDALRQGNAQIKYIEQENYLPICLYGGFNGGKITIDSSISSQFLTALLIATPLAKNDTIIEIKGDLISKPYIDMTLHLINVFGVRIENQSYKKFIIRGQQQYHSPGHYLIEGDASSASYFLAAAAIKGGTVRVIGVGSNSIQGDIHFANILEKMGATITWDSDYIACTNGNLYAIDMDMNHIPDAAMTIAIIALFAKGTTVIRNIYSWRIKETDRIFAMTTELRKVGAIVEEYRDCICITPPTELKYAKINTYNDHRMAMCFSLIALSGTSVTILNPQCTTKTFPDYFKQLAHISVPYFSKEI